MEEKGNDLENTKGNDLERDWRDELDEYWKCPVLQRIAQDRQMWKQHAEAFTKPRDTITDSDSLCLCNRCYN